MIDSNEFRDFTPEQIKDILKSSGYLFEQRVASVIEKLGYATYTNKAYLDDDEGKSREIDVVAMKTIVRKEPNNFVSCYLNCECKNSTTPFVFITRNKGSIDKYYIPDGLFFFPKEYREKLGDGRVLITAPFKKLDLYREHFATREMFKAVQITKIIRNQKKIEAQHSGVIESLIYPLIKSQKAWVKEYVGERTNSAKFFFNLVIVNSSLYTIDSELEESMPKKVKYVPFVRDVHTNTMRGNHLITFVNFDFLEEFIDSEIERFCEKVCEIYQADKNLLLPPPLDSIS